MLILSKFVQKLISPLGLSVLTMLWLTVGPASTARTRRLAGFAFIVLFFPSLPVISDRLIGYLEGEFSPQAPAAAPNFDSIVVLGGTAAPQWSSAVQAEELGGSRLLTANRIFRGAPRSMIVVTSGVVRPQEDGRSRAEAEDMRDILVSMGVPSESIVLEDRALNTFENAQYTARLFEKQGRPKKVILVTSAYHLKRAAELFRRAGFEVFPVGAGRSQRSESVDPIDFVPSAQSLTRSTAACKELLALFLMRFGFYDT